MARVIVLKRELLGITLTEERVEVSSDASHQHKRTATDDEQAGRTSGVKEADGLVEAAHCGDWSSSE